MRESRKIVLGLLLVCSLLFFVSCDQNPGSNQDNTELDGGDNTVNDNTGDDNTGDDNTGDDNTGDDVVENPTQTMNNNIVMTKLLGETHDVEPEKRIEVIFTANNIPTDVAADGTEVVLAGFWICDSTGTEYDWKAGADEISEFLTDTVTDSSVTITFYYDAGNTNTDFKVFLIGWGDVVTDPNAGDGNIKIDFSDFAEAGDVVEVVMDASLATAE